MLRDVQTGGFPDNEILASLRLKDNSSAGRGGLAIDHVGVKKLESESSGV